MTIEAELERGVTHGLVKALDEALVELADAERRVALWQEAAHTAEIARAEAVDILRGLYYGERGARLRAKVLLAHHAGFHAGTDPATVDTAAQ